MPRVDVRVVAIAAGLLSSAVAAEAQGPYGLGRVASPAEIAGWNIDIGRDGHGLPQGSGTVGHGREVFAQQCAGCQGDTGQGGIGDRLVGGQGTLATPEPVRTVGSYWPYATTLFDYIRRAMPFKQPGTLTPNQVYALCAHILNLNGIVPDNAVMDAKTLSQVKMPNRNGFVSDPRP